MDAIVDIPLPLPHIGSVNAWLLKGDPLTLVDTGPRDERALEALEAGLRREGVRLDDIELVLGTHHHLDHLGLAATIQRRAGARIAVLDATAGYLERYADRTAMDRRFSRALMAHHGVPAAVIADSDGFWDYIVEGTERFDADVRLRDGDRDPRRRPRAARARATGPQHDRHAVRRRGRRHRVRRRPPARRHLVEHRDLSGGRARRHAPSRARRVPAPTSVAPPACRCERLLTGHGQPVTDHAQLVEARLDEHRRRCRRIAAILADGPLTAFAIAAGLWSETTLAEQPLFVVWEVLGHLDLLIDAGVVAERIGDDGQARFDLRRWAATPR